MTKILNFYSKKEQIWVYLSPLMARIDPEGTREKFSKNHWRTVRYEYPWPDDVIERAEKRFEIFAYHATTISRLETIVYFAAIGKF